MMRASIQLAVALSLLCEISYAQSSVNIGAILHLSGDQAMQGQAFREGIELASSEINMQGGCNGTQLKVLFEDSQLKPKEAHAAAKKLIEVNKVVAGVNASFLESMANGKEFEQAKIPVVTLWDSSPQIENIGKYIFGIGIWTPSAGQEAARFVRQELGAATASIINTQNEWSESVAKYFKDEFERLGGKILSTSALMPSVVDFKSIFTKTLKNKPDVLYTPITDNVIAFYKQLNQIPIKSVIVTSDIITAAHIAENPGSFEGIFQTQSQDPNSPEAQSLAQNYSKHFKRQATQLLLTAWGYDALHLICFAIKVGSANPEAIAAELYKIKNFKGASGVISINAEGSSPVKETIFVIKDGKIEMPSLTQH